MRFEPIDWAEAGQRLSQGQIGVVPTDTLYGIVGSALKPATVERIYGLRQRELDKPMIVLLGAWSDFERLQIALDERTRGFLKQVWPGPVSVVVPVLSPALKYLHRGTDSIAFRMPRSAALTGVLRAAGPLVAPSANVAGEEPARTVAEAYDYFGDEVFYIDGGHLSNPASALVDVRANPPRILRPAPGFKLQ